MTYIVRICYRGHDGTTVTAERVFTGKPSTQLWPATPSEPWPRAMADDGEHCWIVRDAMWIECIPES